MINRDEIDTQGAIERQTIAAALAVNDELEGVNPNIEIDAKEFGEHTRNGGWRLGLLVARSVKPQQGARSDLSTDGEVAGKITQTAFARLAAGKGSGSPTTVAKYLKAWGLAAADGLVPEASKLKPGQGVAFVIEEDAEGNAIGHTAKAWNEYFNGAADDKNPAEIHYGKVKAAGKIDPYAFTVENFTGQGFTVNEVYQAALTAARLNQAVMENCHRVAEELGHRIGSEDNE